MQISFGFSLPKIKKQGIREKLEKNFAPNFASKIQKNYFNYNYNLAINLSKNSLELIKITKHVGFD